MMLSPLFSLTASLQIGNIPLAPQIVRFLKKEYVFAPNKRAQPKFFEKNSIAFCG